MATTIIGLSGSLRRGSYNTALLRAAASLMPADSALQIHTLHDVPLYDGDVEAGPGIPPGVVALKNAIVAADALLLGTPEYNNGIPGVFKNTIDWLSRPPEDAKRVFGNRPVALIGASTGNFGTILSQAAWLPVLRTLGTRYWTGSRLLVSRSNQLFDESGALVDAKTREQLQAFLAGFVSYVRESRATSPQGSSQKP